MISEEAILIAVKSSILEFALKHQLDDIVNYYAINETKRFSDYNIDSIRFSLYYTHTVVLKRECMNFDRIIEFLETFYLHFSTVLNEKLYQRVTNTLKFLHIYEYLRNDVKKAASLLKKYFPRSQSTDDLINENKENNKLIEYMEMGVNKFRLHCQQMIISTRERARFFETKYDEIYGKSFYAFFISKVNDLVNTITSYLPKTRIEELADTKFQNFHQILFNSEDELSDMDEVRLSLLFDSLKECSSRESIKDCIYRIKDFIECWPFENLSQHNIRFYMQSQQTSFAQGILYLDSQIPDYSSNETTTNNKTVFTTALDTVHEQEQHRVSDIITDDDERDTST